MILSKQDALYAANVFESFFSDMSRIDDYMRQVKMERMSTFPAGLPGMGIENDFFDKYDMHPEDMEFVIQETKVSNFHQYLEVTSSAAVESNIPGKSMCILVKEKNTGLIVGMIRLGSPTINSKPRNEWLGRPLDSHNPEVMKRFNASAIMGFAIVAAQPFGFNALGGKLLAGICCSHEIRRRLDKKYGTKICMFETTSLYGTTKTASQYDGIPFLKFNGLTESDFAPLLNNQNFTRLDEWFTKKNGGVPLVEKDATSRKLKSQTKMVGVIKSSLKQHDPEAYAKFCQTYSNAHALTERKRSYVSTYGYEGVPAYLNLETDELKKKENYDRFELEGVYEWWKKQATKRYNKLKEEGRLRTKLETWNTNAEDIDIIR